MLALTPSERRGAAVIVLLLVIGAGYDLWRARSPRHTPPPGAWTEDPAPAVPPVPATGPDRSAARPTVTTAPAPAGAPIDLNRASVSQLDALPGIGPVLAGRIVAHREAHGAFERLEDLLAVRGIGPRLVERLRPHVRVAAPDRENLPR